MRVFESPELLQLFETYTASPTSIGAHLGQAAARTNVTDPLIVATGSDIALYPGAGAPPTVQGFRLSTRGFKELAGVSHLGPALATLSMMRELDESGRWRGDAERLLDVTRAARAANSTALWRDQIAVEAFVGREEAIAAMVAYSCRLTERFLERTLDRPSYLTDAALRRDYLEGPGDDLPVSFNRVMVATFFLTGMDVGHRLITWFDGLDLPWEQAMVIIAGRQGRPTAGVSQESNSVAGVVHAASRDRLPLERLLIAPHAPVFPMFDGTNMDGVAALEDPYRRLWSSLRAMSELGARMFDAYPRFRPRTRVNGSIEPGTAWVHEKPAVRGPDDWFALTTRLRVVMEDPRQLLSGAVTDYASRQLVENANDPLAITVPGLDGEPYPEL
ncbi:MAG: hypothetical protein JWN32_1618 [Solirubrobacterales bacterium]|jgi:hypothetical protein|nr:hypothetical protein [Solirubrobacterales bacterium]